MELARPLLLFATISSFAHANEYAIPLPDQIDNASLPCITGVINETSEGIILIETDKSRKISVQLSSTTNMFTIYGGKVFKNNIKPLLNVKVWYKGKSCKEPNLPLEADTIIFASKKPGDAWPIK